MRTYSVLAAVLCTLSLAWTTLQNPPSAQAQAPATARPEAPEFPANMEWLNTDQPLTMKSLRGKVVLFDFWTYCCINCIHIMPELKKLEAKYPNELVVVGVHSAKFFNEKDSGNIREAILRYELEHPVVNDKDFLIWNGYGVRSWPTFVLIDTTGHYVGSVSGEGNYDLLDQTINKLIVEAETAKTLTRSPMKFALEKEKRPKSVLSYPGKIAADPQGHRLFFSDSNHNRIIVASLAGEIQEVIGEGGIGLKDGDYTTAQFYRPQGVTYDPANNALFVADTENHAIRRVDLGAKTVTTLAGNGKKAIAYPPQPGTGKAVSLSSPWDVLRLNNTLFIAMAGCHQLWAIDLKTLKAAPFAGTGGENIVDGPNKSSLLAQPSGLTHDGMQLYFADSEVSALRGVDMKKNIVSTLIGKGLFEFGDIDGSYPMARLQHPIGVTYHNGYVYVADTYNHKIRRYNFKTKQLETCIGTGTPGMEDGEAKKATLREPNGLVFVGEKAYIADTNNHLIRVYDSASGKLSTLQLSGLDKLTRSMPSIFTGKERKLPAVSIAPSARTVELAISLPPGTKFSPNAPFRVHAVSSNKASVSVNDFVTLKPAGKISIPIVPKSGDSVLTLEVSVSYCAEGNTGLCYFKEEKLLVPIQISAKGESAPTVNYSL